MPLKQLKQASTGRIFTWTKALSQRTDMIPWPPVTTGGLVERGSEVDLIELGYGEKSFRMAKDSVDDFNAMANELDSDD